MRIFDLLLKFYQAPIREICPDCKGSGHKTIKQDPVSGPEIIECETCQAKGKLGIIEQPKWPSFFWTNTLVVRVKFWLATWEMIKQKPILGHGLNSYKLLYPKIVAELDQKTEGKFLDASHFPVIVSEHAHNDFLEEIAELGVIGFILFCVIFGTVLWMATEPLLTAALIGSLVTALAFYTTKDTTTGFCLWFLAGLICSS